MPKTIFAIGGTHSAAMYH